jgi:hypothetical protein
MGFTFYFSILFLIVFGGILYALLSTLKRAGAPLSWPALLPLGLIALLLLLAPFRPFTAFYQTHFLFPLLVIPASLALSTLLILQAFRIKDQLRNSRLQEVGPPRSASPWMGIASLITSGLLLLVTLYRLYWFLVWDSTYDPIGDLFFLPLLAAAVACGFGLALGLPRGFRTARLVFLFAFPLLLFGTYDLANHIDFRVLTAQRLERVGWAVETYYARQGRYPQELNELTPRYLLSIPEPVYIQGQDWCYDASEDGFQLAYLTRDHWSSPYLSAHPYHAESNPAVLERLCSEQVVALQQRQPWAYWHFQE